MGSERGENRYLEFVYLELFERTRNGVISDEEMKVLEDELLENPEKGSVQRDTGGVRKVRVATRGGGRAAGLASPTCTFRHERRPISSSPFRRTCRRISRPIRRRRCASW